jgi:hypothetical protein
VLYSDLYDHRVYIRALVNSGFSGLLWCPEVRQADSVEDLIHRLQSVVFSPLAQVDCWFLKNPPWKQIDKARNNAGQLLENWQSLEARCREIIGWRMRGNSLRRKNSTTLRSTISWLQMRSIATGFCLWRHQLRTLHTAGLTITS